MKIFENAIINYQAFLILINLDADKMQNCDELLLILFLNNFRLPYCKNNDYTMIYKAKNN